MCSWVVTKPDNITEAETKRFFEETYKFLSNRYGTANVISAYVHMDESNPHMHFAFVPVAHDTKKNRDTVAANKVINRSELQKFHPALTKHMIKAFGRDVGIETGEVAGRGEVGNLTIKQIKGLTDQLTAIRTQNQLLQAENVQLRANQQDNAEELRQLKALKSTIQAFLTDVESKKDQIRKLTDEEKAKLKPKGMVKRELRTKIGKDKRLQIVPFGGEINEFLLTPPENWGVFIADIQKKFDVLIKIIEDKAKAEYELDKIKHPKFDFHEFIKANEEQQRRKDLDYELPKETTRDGKQWSDDDEWER
jgi:hypothetical protein